MVKKILIGVIALACIGAAAFFFLNADKEKVFKTETGDTTKVELSAGELNWGSPDENYSFNVNIPEGYTHANMAKNHMEIASESANKIVCFYRQDESYTVKDAEGRTAKVASGFITMDEKGEQHCADIITKELGAKGILGGPTTISGVNGIQLHFRYEHEGKNLYGMSFSFNGMSDGFYTIAMMGDEEVDVQWADFVYSLKVIDQKYKFKE